MNQKRYYFLFLKFILLKSVENSIFFDSDEIYTKFGDFWSIIFKFPILYTVIRLCWFMHHELHCGIFILKNLMWFDERVFDDDKIHLDFWQTKYTLTDICSVWIDETDLLYVWLFFFVLCAEILRLAWILSCLWAVNGIKSHQIYEVLPVFSLSKCFVSDFW